MVIWLLNEEDTGLHVCHCRIITQVNTVQVFWDTINVIKNTASIDDAHKEKKSSTGNGKVATYYDHVNFLLDKNFHMI